MAQRRGVRIVRTVTQLRREVDAWRASGLRSAVVPTMGALHDGHLRLVKRALRLADRVVVTIFVNPMQFAPSEDLERYPRNERADAEKLKTAGAHLIYAPELQEMYPEGFATTITMAGPAKAGLEDAHRPHFFDGVATVVTKLLLQARCDHAMFGEKDYQQLKVVTRLVRDLDLKTSIMAVETVREPDGLAMSSRNAYLDEEQRALAPLLHRALSQAADAIRAGVPPASAAADARQLLEQSGFDVHYVEARHAETLAPADAETRSMRLLAAATLGETRLIDNIPV